MIDIPLVLSFLRPGETWVLDGDSYDGLVWTDVTDKPSFAEIEGAWLDALRNKNFSRLRVERNRFLVESDWTQVADAPVNQAAWADYRQALRDLPANTTDPENPIWPTPPE